MIRHFRAADSSIRCCRRLRGTAALEFVIVLPVLMVIVIGVTDFGRALQYENVLSNAARVGAAYGATHQVTDHIAADWETRVIQQATDEAASLPDFDSDLLTIEVSTFDELDGSKRVQVSASYPFERLIHWPGWPRRLTLQRDVSMRSYR